MKNAILCLNIKDFRLLGSVGKERIKKQLMNEKDRTINLFRPEVKRSLQMSGVMVRNSFALHRKVIGQKFCSICQLLGSKLKPFATQLMNKQNNFP